MAFFFKKTNIKLPLTIPTHIAIIMDGNARWAKKNNLPIKVGHNYGAKNIEKIVQDCVEIGIKYLTIYAFSTENWQRPEDEVRYLINLLNEYLDKETKLLSEKNIKIIISGNLEKLPYETQQKIYQIEEQTKENSSLTLNVAFSYGARQEIIDASKKIALAVSESRISVNEIDENFFVKNLYKNIPDPELLIRTAGDIRLSNFLLWQLAYSELYFTKTFWPDFNKKELILAIEDFNKRERRYGKRQ